MAETAVFERTPRWLEEAKMLSGITHCNARTRLVGFTFCTQDLLAAACGMVPDARGVSIKVLERKDLCCTLLASSCSMHMHSIYAAYIYICMARVGSRIEHPTQFLPNLYTALCTGVQVLDFLAMSMMLRMRHTITPPHLFIPVGTLLRCWV